MMTALLLYAYASGERSSRRIEPRCRRDIAYRIITANQAPDHATIARFRADHEAPSATCSTRSCACAHRWPRPTGADRARRHQDRRQAALPANRIGDRLSAEIDVILAEAAAVDAAEDAAFVADRGSDSVLLVQRRFEASLRANEPAYSDAVQTR